MAIGGNVVVYTMIWFIVLQVVRKIRVTREGH